MEKTFSTAENWAEKGCYTDKKKKSQENDFQGLAKPLNSYNVRTCNFSSQHHISVEETTNKNRQPDQPLSVILI